ncbi:MAG: single-stranded DNA-binding protein [Candidatus Izemoplasmatales bacterium]|jgi:single-strand DNA-binding protein|nr:single-stranded DNA-binding protein [Candidatus Izemoplasmatales bacterium]MDD3865687.1 single-stranded DNA-binding protein [Candidatus Izemoplasmatales bacterium]
MLNRVVLVGRLVKDPELRHTNKDNIAFVSFTIAVNRPFSSGSNGSDNSNSNYNNSATDFFPCVAWRKQAENISKYVSKGHMVAVDGRLQTRDYMDEKTNVKRYVTEIICDSVEFLEPKGQSGDNNRSIEKETTVEKDNDIHVIEDDLPF